MMQAQLQGQGKKLALWWLNLTIWSQIAYSTEPPIR